MQNSEQRDATTQRDTTILGNANTQRDATTQLVNEVTRFDRLGQRAKSMLNTGHLGAEFCALMLLFPLRRHGPMRVTDLAELKQADPSTISRQVAQLVKAGLARREADPIDGRASRLALTEAGLTASEKIQDARRELFENFLHEWPAERIATFADLFHQFNSSVEAHMRSDPAPRPLIDALSRTDPSESPRENA